MDDCQPDSSLLEEAVRRLVQAFGPERSISLDRKPEATLLPIAIMTSSS